MTWLMIIILVIGYFNLLSRIQKLEANKGQAPEKDSQWQKKDFLAKRSESEKVFEDKIGPKEHSELIDEIEQEDRPVEFDQGYEAKIMSQDAQSQPVSPEKDYGADDLDLEVEDSHEKLSDETGTESIEFKFGAKGFTVVGIIAVTIGLGFFFSYAIENNLITETGRVAIGILAGLALLAVGWRTRKKYEKYGNMVTGGGLGVLYLSIFAAFNFYHLISQPLGLVFMSLVTISGVVLAVSYDSLALAVFSQLGGFLTPFLLSTGENHPHALFLYIALLNGGMLAIAFYKQWQELVLESFVGTVLVYLAWYISSYSPDQLAVAFSYAALFYLMFLAVFLTYHFKFMQEQEEGLLLLVGLNSALYFMVGYELIRVEHQDLAGLFTFLLSVFHLGLFFLTKDKKLIRLSNFFAGIAAVLMVLAVPIQFDKYWITIGWAAEGMALTWLGIRLKSKNLMDFSQFVFVLTFVRLVSIDTVNAAHANPWLNERMLSFVFSLACYIVSAWAIWKNKANFSISQSPYFSLLFMQLLFVTMLFPSLEIINFYPHWFLSIFWSIGLVMVAFLAIALENLPGRVFALVVLAVLIGRLLLVESVLGPGDFPWLNSRFFTFFVAILSSYILLLLYRVMPQKTPQKEQQKAFSFLILEIYCLTLWMVSAEILDFYRPFWLPVFWSAAALIAGGVAFYVKDIYLKTFTYLTFFLAGGHLLIMETQVNLELFHPIFNSRVFSFLVVATFGGSYVFLMKKMNPEEDKKNNDELSVATVLGIWFYFLMLWLVSFEVLDFFNQRYFQLPAEERILQKVKFSNMKKAYLSVTWALYAIGMLVAGIIKKSAPARLVSVFLFGVVIFKVFLYDTAELDNFYRFVSYITLGIILLLTGYLYNRYKSRISEFIKIG